jgi:hypothetical protein
MVTVSIVHVSPFLAYRIVDVTILFSALCAVLLLFCLVGTIFDVIIEAYAPLKQETSLCDPKNTVQLQAVASPSSCTETTLTRQPNSSSALELPDETDGFGPPRFFKCK